MGFIVVETALRWLVVAALAYALVVAATHWAVRSRRLQPFGAWPRGVRRASDPVLRPLERRVIRLGGSPQDAPWWLLGAVVALGLVLLSLVRWLRGWWYRMQALADGGTGPIVYTVVAAAFTIVQLAILVRVIGSWFGASLYSPWMRPVRLLTDWIIEPLRRVLPTVGPFDLSPLAAYFLLWVLEGFVVLPLLRSMLG